MCNYWQGYSSKWEEVAVSYCYKMEEQNDVILREQMVSTFLFSYPSATEWTQIMYWKKPWIFRPTESLKEDYYTKDTGCFFFLIIIHLQA